MKISLDSVEDKSVLKVSRVLDIPSNTLYEVVDGHYNGYIVTRYSFLDRLICIYPKVCHFDEGDCLSGKFKKLPKGFVVKIEQII